MGRHTLSRAEALKARAARARENPYRMTSDANIGRLAKHVVALINENPDLDDASLAKAARLRLRAEMAELAEKSVKARAERKAAAALKDGAA